MLEIPWWSIVDNYYLRISNFYFKIGIFFFKICNFYFQIDHSRIELIFAMVRYISKYYNYYFPLKLSYCTKSPKINVYLLNVVLESFLNKKKLCSCIKAKFCKPRYLDHLWAPKSCFSVEMVSLSSRNIEEMILKKVRNNSCFYNVCIIVRWLW